MEVGQNQPVVMDLGAGLTKGGFAASAEPAVVMGTVVGRVRHTRVMGDGGSDGKVVVGEMLGKYGGVVGLERPIGRRGVEDWDGAEMVWRECLKGLGVEGGVREHGVLVTENVMGGRAKRERLAEMWFESIGCGGLGVAVPGVLALYATGRLNGVVLDVGDVVSSVVPIAEGFVVERGVSRTEWAGRDVTERLETLVRRAGCPLSASSSEREAVRRIKERHCYVAASPREEEMRAKGENAADIDVRFELPDGNGVHVGPERFRAPEILFNPALVGSEMPGVQDCLHHAVDAVDMELRKRMYSSMLLAGGSTKFRGFGQRLLREMRDLAPPDTKIRIHAPPDRLYTAYTGGSILASLSTTWRSFAISRAEYFENGASIVHRKAL